MAKHGRRYRGSWMKSLHLSKKEPIPFQIAHTAFLAERMVRILCQADFTAINIHEL